MCSGRPKEKVKAGVLAPWLNQSRPKRPRPAVCDSATNKMGSVCPARARRISSELVESICGRISTLKLGRAGDTASQIASAGHWMGIDFDKLSPNGSWANAKQTQRLRLGASSVPRQVFAPHQQGYSALSLGV